MNLIALGINHNSAALEVRERVAFAPEQVSEALVDACDAVQVEEVVILSTCNRTEVYAIVPGGCRAPDKALQLIERRQRNRAALERSPYDSLESAINAAAVSGMDAETAQEIGYLAGIKPVTAAKIMTDAGGEALAVLCKATGVKRQFLPVLWAALRRPLELDEGVIHPQFAHVAETYELLTVAKAQTTLRYWNWSLSSAFSPTQTHLQEHLQEPANEEAAFSAAQRTARLVFGR